MSTVALPGDSFYLFAVFLPLIKSESRLANILAEADDSRKLMLGSSSGTIPDSSCEVSQFKSRAEQSRASSRWIFGTAWCLKFEVCS